MPSTGFFRIVEPGLVYVQRLTLQAAASLSLGVGEDAPIEGEWLNINGNKWERETAKANWNILYPIIVDEGRTDVQSGRRITAIVHPGAQVTTAVFARQTNGGGAYTFTEGEDLFRTSYIDVDNANIIRVGLGNISAFGAAVGTATGDTQESDNVPVAKVLRGIYQVDRRDVLDIVLL